jgi:hypothetical protein
MHAKAVLIRLDAPAPGAAYVGAFSRGGVMVCMSVYLHGADAKAAVERDEPTRPRWMSERFPMPQAG